MKVPLIVEFYQAFQIWSSEYPMDIIHNMDSL